MLRKLEYKQIGEPCLNQDSVDECLENPRKSLDAKCMRVFAAIQSSLLKKGLTSYKYIFLFAVVHFFINTFLCQACVMLGWHVGGTGGNSFTWDETRMLAPDDELGVCPCTMKIPKIIHQTYKSDKLPDHWKQTPVEWQENHPDWQYEFWSDERNRKLIEEHYPWFLEQYDSYPTPIQRSDAIRYFILHHHGGIYADLDIISSRNLEQLLQNEELVLWKTPNAGITNSLMASVPGHRFFEKLHEDMKNWKNPWFYSYLPYLEICFSTGSGMLWYAWSTWTDPYKYSDAAIVNMERYGKYNMCQGMKPSFLRRRNPNTHWFHHVVGNSWHNEGLELLIVYYIRCFPVPCSMIIVLAVMSCILLYVYVRKPQSVQQLFETYTPVRILSTYILATIALIWLS